MFGIATILPTKQLLKIIATEIEKQLFKDVPKFDLIYKASDNSLAFRVGEDLYAFEDSIVTSTVKEMAEKEIENGDVLNMVIAHYDSTNSDNDNADIYFTDKDGEKINIKFKY